MQGFLKQKSGEKERGGGGSMLILVASAAALTSWTPMMRSMGKRP